MSQKTREKKKRILASALCVMMLLFSLSAYAMTARVGNLPFTLTPNTNGYGSVSLDWRQYNYSNKNFKVYKSSDGGRTYETVGIDYRLVKEVRVLNIYPTRTNSSWPVNKTISFKSALDNKNYTLPASASIKMWMEKPNSESSTGYGKGIIKVDALPISSFNNNPNAYLKDSSGNWKYDVIYIGTWNGNGGENFSSTSIKSIEEWINAGKGLIGGHDTMTNGCTTYDKNYFRTLYKYFGILDFNGASYGTGSNNELVTIENKGLLTNYPWYIGEKEKQLSVPKTHNSRERYDKATTWLRWSSRRISKET